MGKRASGVETSGMARGSLPSDQMACGDPESGAARGPVERNWWVAAGGCRRRRATHTGSIVGQLWALGPGLGGLGARGRGCECARRHGVRGRAWCCGGAASLRKPGGCASGGMLLVLVSSIGTATRRARATAAAANSSSDCVAVYRMQRVRSKLLRGSGTAGLGHGPERGVSGRGAVRDRVHRGVEDQGERDRGERDRGSRGRGSRGQGSRDQGVETSRGAGCGERGGGGASTLAANQFAWPCPPGLHEHGCRHSCSTRRTGGPAALGSRRRQVRLRRRRPSQWENV